MNVHTDFRLYRSVFIYKCRVFFLYTSIFIRSEIILSYPPLHLDQGNQFLKYNIDFHKHKFFYQINANNWFDCSGGYCFQKSWIYKMCHIVYVFKSCFCTWITFIYTDCSSSTILICILENELCELHVSFCWWLLFSFLEIVQRNFKTMYNALHCLSL